jgi:hypothetical protein
MAEKDVATIVQEIDDVLRDIWKHFHNPENLSTDILKLAVLNGGLGNGLAEAFDAERRAEASYKHSVDKLKLENVTKGDSATVAESKAKQEMFVDQIKWIEKQHQLTVLKLKRQDTDSAIDAARSRLSLIKQDMKQA